MRSTGRSASAGVHLPRRLEVTHLPSPAAVVSRRALGGSPVFVSCWSVKGGSGTTVVASSLALLLATRSPAGSVLVDLAGDVPAVLGIPEPDGPGVSDWLAAGDSVPADG